jgi:hypothetical protein
MLIQRDISEILLKRLKRKAWVQKRGYAMRGNPRVLTGRTGCIAVVKPIKIDPFKELQSEIDKFFRSLIEIIKKNGIKSVFLPGGGNVPIPKFFLDFCEEFGIKIIFYTSENIDDFQDWDFMDI